MPPWLTILVPLPFAVVAAAVMTASRWGDIKQGLSVALAILCGAVFVRLARGLPITNTENLTVDEVKRLTSAVKLVTDRLVALLVIAFACVLALVFVEPMLKAIHVATWFAPDWKTYAEWGVSGGLVYLIVFTFFRTIALIQSDRSVLEVQSEFLRKSVQRRVAADFAERQKAADGDSPFRSPDNYGARIDH